MKHAKNRIRAAQIWNNYICPFIEIGTLFVLFVFLTILAILIAG